MVELMIPDLAPKPGFVCAKDIVADSEATAISKKYFFICWLEPGFTAVLENENAKGAERLIGPT